MGYRLAHSVRRMNTDETKNRANKNVCVDW